MHVSIVYRYCCALQVPIFQELTEEPDMLLPIKSRRCGQQQEVLS